MFRILRFLALTLSVATLTLGLYLTFIDHKVVPLTYVQVLGEINSLSETTETKPLFVFKLTPEVIQLEPLKQHRFRAYVETNTGKKEIDPSLISWAVVNGGGKINHEGVFQAWDAGGKYPHTIRARYLDHVAQASVEIVQPAQHTFEPVKTTTSPTPTPSPPQTTLTKPSPSPTPNTTTTPTTVRVPSPTPTTKPTTTPISSPTGKTTDTQLPVLAPTQPSPTSDSRSSNFEPAPEPTSKRFQVDSLQACLRSNFSEQEFLEYFHTETRNKNPQELGSRLSLAERCYIRYRMPNLPGETQTCLRENLGEERFTQLLFSQETPNTKELHLSSSCFTKPVHITYQQPQELDPHLVGCLNVVVGSDMVTQTPDQSKLTKAQVQRARSCFNLQENLAQPLVIDTPTEVSTCIAAQVSTQRLAQLRAGAKPTTQESQLSSTCLQMLEPTQRAFLPTPAEIVPLLPPKESELQVTTAAINNRETKNTVLLQGTALPNSIIDIYIFSDPLIVTTTTDANGNWSYELFHHLPEGEHKAYAVVNHPDQGLIRSELFTFQVAYAQTIADDTTIPQLVSVTPVLRNQTYTYLGAGMIFTSTAFLLVFGYYWKRSSAAQPSQPQPASVLTAAPPPSSPPTSPPVN